jgi:carbamoylphosphate synthase large subunit
LQGPADVDIRCGADGVPAVLEINARFGANSAYAPEIVDALLDEWLPHASGAVA